MDQYLDHLLAERYRDAELEGEEQELRRVKNILKEGIEEYQEEKGFKIQMPAIRFENTLEIWQLSDEATLQDITEEFFDEDEYELIFPEFYLNDFDSGTLKNRAKEAVRELAEYRFSELTGDSLEKLDRIYSGTETVIERIMVSDLENSLGEYKNRKHAKGRSIQYDFSLVNLVDMKTGEVLDTPKIPPGKVGKEQVDPTPKPTDITDHEVAHPIQFQNNPYTIILSSFISNEVADSEDEDYQYDIRRASIEAITTFEEELNHEGEKSDWEKDVENPFSLANLIRKNASPGEELLYDNPYTLGRVTSFSIDAALREKHGDQKGRELAREYLLEIATSPEGLEGAIENSLEIRGLPNIHEKIRNRYEQLKSAENIKVELFKATHQINSSFGNDLNHGQMIDLYNEYQALECVYTELNDSQVPEKYSELVREKYGQVKGG